MGEVTQLRESSLAPPPDIEIGLQVIERLAVGRSLDEIGAQKGFPSKETFLIWLIQSPPLAQAFAKAREVSGYALEEEALALLRGLKDEVMTAPKAKAIDMLVQQLRWSAEKRNPSVYSRQNNVNVQIPVQITTSLDLGEMKTGVGTAEFPNIYELTTSEWAEKQATEVPVKPKTRRERIEKRNTPEREAEIKAQRAYVVAQYRARKRLLKAEPPKPTEGEDDSNPQD
jgi:hypothetical protein